MSKTSRDVKPFGGFSSVFCGRKKKTPFSGTGFRVSKSWMKTPPKGWLNLQKNNAVRGWNLQNTRIVPNRGDVLVVDSQLILFTYYNTQDAE